MKWWWQKWWRLPLFALGIWLIGDWELTLIAMTLGIMAGIVVLWIRESKGEKIG